MNRHLGKSLFNQIQCVSSKEIKTFFSALILLLNGCAPDVPTGFQPPSGSTLPPVSTPTPSQSISTASTQKKEAKVDVLWTKNDSDGPKGGTSPFTVRMESNSGNKVGINFTQYVADSSRPQWEASGWMALARSSFLLGEDINKYKFEMDIEGRIEGPSAGAITTVTVLSLLRGDSIKSEVAMTGTINPDGTIGPVGGIPLKLEGAQKKGKKLVLIPLGQLSSEVLEKKQKLGIEVREVGDIYEAYQAMTDKPLPKPIGSIAEQPSLPSNAIEKLKSKVKDWQSRYQEKFSEFVAAGSPNILEFSNQATAAFAKSESYLNQGNITWAYDKAQEATVLITIATDLNRLVNSYQQQGLNTALNSLDPIWKAANSRIEGTTNRLKIVQPKTSTDALVLTEAYGNLAIAQGLMEIAKENINRKPKNREEVGKFLFYLAIAPALANLQAQVALDSLDIGQGGGTSPNPDSKKLEGFTNILEQSATANISYFNAVFLSTIPGNNSETGAVDIEFRNFDIDYAFAKAAMKVLPSIKDKVGGGDAGSYATLGTVLAAYQYSSGLIAKYYSLGAEFKNGNFVGVSREGAMIRMLDLAEQRSRESITLAKKTGNDPVLPIILFESAKHSREGNITEKINALKGFWTATNEAELMAIFSGQFKLP